MYSLFFPVAGYYRPQITIIIQPVIADSAVAGRSFILNNIKEGGNMDSNIVNTTEETEENSGKYIPVINQIAHAYSEYVDWDVTPDNPDLTEGDMLETLLTDIIYNLGEAAKLTKNAVDIEFCLSLVATYVLAKEQGTLDGTEPDPAELFDKNIFERLNDVSDSDDSTGLTEVSDSEVPREDS